MTGAGMAIRLGGHLGLSEVVEGFQDRTTDLLGEARDRLGAAVADWSPEIEDPRGNLERGTVAGGMLAAVALLLDEFGLPLTADTEITDAESVAEGTLYTIHLVAPVEQQARFKAKLEAGQGLPGFITQNLRVRSAERVERGRLRDTWEFKVLVER